MTLFGVDYSGSRPDPKCLAANGVKFVGRYLEPANDWKTLTKAEADGLLAAGIAIVGMFETSANRALAGYTAGAIDAAAVAAHASEVGMPVDRPVYFAVDFDATPTQLAGPVTAYFRGVASVVGVDLVGGYGGYNTIKYLFDNDLIRWGHQAAAWSTIDGVVVWDERAHIQQYAAERSMCGTTGDIDFNRGMFTDFGQWPAPPRPKDTMTTITAAGRNLTYHDREAWVDPTAKGFEGAPVAHPDLVGTAVIHYPGETVTSNTDMVVHLRNHMRISWASKGFSYYYGFVIGNNPVNWSANPVVLDVWEVRGVDLQNAANNGDFPPYSDYTNPNWNGYTTSIQILCDDGAHPVTEDQMLQARYMIAWFDTVYAQTMLVQGHNVSDSTSCPGTVLTSRMPELRTRPTPPPPPPPDPGDDDDMTQEQLDQLVTRVATAVWDKVIGKDDAKSLLVWSATKAGESAAVVKQLAATNRVEHATILDAVVTGPTTTP